MKTERPSDALLRFAKDSIKMQEEQGREFSMKSVIRRTFNRITGFRDKCLMEVCHLINSTPYIQCDHQFCSVNLFSGVRAILPNDESVNNDNQESICRDNILNLYSKRLISSKWHDQSSFYSYTGCLEKMSFFKFLTLFDAYSPRNQTVTKIRERDTKAKPVVSVFSQT